ncbi:XAP5, circadian clock regulator-domain-containing protein [Xylariaceae sp. FL0016]|nr:XAP5, circadian clock regulator-domain-containing protein [Xylariaceae sp. FL0016]
MSSSESRFTSENKTTQQRISNNTVGLVALSDFRKRRAEVLEQQEREARESTNNSTPDRSLNATPDKASDSSAPKKKKKKGVKAATKLSFDDSGEEDEATAEGTPEPEQKKSKFKANSSVSVVPRSLTKSALRREAAEREVLRREFLARQEAVKTTEIAVPFVFYDGSNIPGGVVRVKKGDFVWVFLDKSRKVGAEMGVGEKANAHREWARVGVDDLMMVRGNVIIPHHYEFLFFIMNRTAGPAGKLLFDYTSEAPKPKDPDANGVSSGLQSIKSQSDISSLEGASDDPSFTKVVDRRWYEQNKHIFPASVWQDFDPEKDYQQEVKRDIGGNAFFYS